MRSRSHAIWRQSYLVLLLGGVAVAVLGIVLSGGDRGDVYANVLYGLGLALILAGHVCAGVLLSRAWRCVSDRRSRLERGRRILEPGVAVLFTFVPLVNVIGTYFSLGLLPGALNDLARGAGIPRRAPASLGGVCAVLVTLALIPILRWLAGVVLLGCLPGFFLSCSRLADEIESRVPAEQPEGHITTASV